MRINLTAMFGQISHNFMLPRTSLSLLKHSEFRREGSLSYSIPLICNKTETTLPYCSYCGSVLMRAIKYQDWPPRVVLFYAKTELQAAVKTPLCEFVFK